jgi:predicted DNA repair protein MutK
VGTAAMIWVGGGIILHGLDEFGLHAPAEWVHHAAEGVAHAVPALGGFLKWLVESALYGVAGLLIGAALIPIAGYVISPAWGALKGLRKQAA